MDVRREIFEQLSNRVTIINDATIPITVKSERFLAGIVLKDAAAAKIVTEGIRKCFVYDKRSRLGWSRARWFGSTTRRGRRRKTAGAGHHPPTTSVTVAGDVLFITTHADLLERC